jgi:hypothetical protein
VASSGKLTGKTEWAERRRPMTRQAGYKARAQVRVDSEALDGYLLGRGQSLTLVFSVPESDPDEWAGFGGWFATDAGIEVDLHFGGRAVLTDYEPPSWNKVGTQLQGDHEAYDAILTFTAKRRGVVTIYDMLAGGIQHDYIDETMENKPEVLNNQWSIAPEANFYDPARPGYVTVEDRGLRRVPGHEILLKSCNRCGRFLPINAPHERDALSYSNHHSTPTCDHATFGRISVADSNDVIAFRYGFQMECRFCKKFEVNLALNPQRTAGQMKEDGARRRHFELLLEHLYGGSPQLRYKTQTGRDLASDIYERFGGRCFKCGTALSDEKAMHLDHTRPLAMLWPLDETATALCSTHNSEKRDRAPAEFYTAEELERLADLTGVPLAQLQDPSPNVKAIDLLGERLDWFYDEFLQLPQLQRVRDCKLTADLVVKALRRVLYRYPGGAPFTLE